MRVKHDLDKLRERSDFQEIMKYPKEFIVYCIFTEIHFANLSVKKIKDARPYYEIDKLLSESDKIIAATPTEINSYKDLMELQEKNAKWLKINEKITKLEKELDRKNKA
ncbi:MAG: hypothetical protein IJP58_03015 [Clostridia bacterium]|nr:hypothetical protein [Clostridia bacterium]